MVIKFKAKLLVSLVFMLSFAVIGFNSQQNVFCKSTDTNKQQICWAKMTEKDAVYSEQWSPPAQRLSFTKNEHYVIFTLLFFSALVPADAEVLAKNKKNLPYPLSLQSCEVSARSEGIDLTRSDYVIRPNDMVLLFVHPGLINLPFIGKEKKCVYCPDFFRIYEFDNLYETASVKDRGYSDRAWNHIEKNYFNSADRPIILLLSTSRERFKENLLHIANAFMAGTPEQGQFRGPDGTMYMSKVTEFPFLAKAEWREYTALNNPELISSLEALEAIANNLPGYASREPKLEHLIPRLRKLAEENFDMRMRVAIELLIRADKLSENAFVNYFIDIIKNYSPKEFIHVFGTLRKKTLNLINEGKIIEAAAYLHMRIVEIHPAMDANGRTARALLNIALMSFGIDPVIFPSNEEYQAAVQNAKYKKDYRIFASYIHQISEIQKNNKPFFDQLIDRMQRCQEECQDLLNGLIESAK